MNDLIAILASVTVVSFVAFIGIIFIGLKEDKLKRLTVVLVGFAAGTLIGGAFLHLLPESLSAGNDATSVFWVAIVGIISFFALEKFLY
ncbi:ZIP family metal transporter, partial [Candidatus Bathyarchaeota archaeon]|nr:ZIP family metal transporter [Candidatus Bathyarchaeota archaeon]